MPTFPAAFQTLILPYAALFCKRVFTHAQLLPAGAILTPGKRTVTAALRIMGLAQHKAFHKYHRLLSHANWSALAASRLLLQQIVRLQADNQPIVVGIDETLERRWGHKIKARGIYRDAVRSSGSHFVKCSGLRWMSVMLLVKIPWADRIWALPFLTALAPSKGFYEDKKRQHKPLTEWAIGLLKLVKRWMGERKVIAVGDSGYAVLELLHQLSGQVALISRLRLDAALYEPAPPAAASKKGRKPLKGNRLPTLQAVSDDSKTAWQQATITDWYGGQTQQVSYCSQTAIWYHTGKPPVAIRWVLVKWQGKVAAFLCNDVTIDAVSILGYFVRRWSMETTFALVRAHLGVENQRQWSNKAISRTTPVLFGLFSLIVLLADELARQGLLEGQSSSWYHKSHLTFSDTLGCVRRHFWRQMHFQTSASGTDVVKLSAHQFSLWENALAWAA
ncbi:IS701 family transposase [Spirosoma utsteinense]|uniref:Transposase IS701-like DDE domain-containing protein n=1 Tax=Spirosoma utsteinense TaxID=2585773 RepID=A0ABR6WG46_9BACT|nr:transposase [Spirosoma utsteinense]MBC3789402.1 hypothetical protein [Spirosoma utsteinense]MBC3795304.1 hypothetical protein [Spirosoma utsteinense]